MPGQKQSAADEGDASSIFLARMLHLNYDALSPPPAFLPALACRLRQGITAMTCRAVLLTLTLFVAATGRTDAQGYSPEEALKRMQVPEGFQVKLCASEPEV